MTSGRSGAPGNGSGPVRPEVSGLLGLWRRSLLIDIDGTTDTSTDVSWLQGPESFVDLRQPAGRPDFAGVRCLEDVSREQQQWMSTQAGFAGLLVAGGEFFEWRRQWDLQPRHTTPDAGTLNFDGSTLIEKGWYESYVEHWESEPSSTGPVGALWLDGGGGATAVLVRVGARFGWARQRGEAGDVPHLEIALGTIVSADVSSAVVPGSRRRRTRGKSRLGWIIERSSLPFREGSDLCFASTTASPQLARGSGERFRSADVSVSGEPVELTWTASRREGAQIG